MTFKVYLWANTHIYHLNLLQAYSSVIVSASTMFLTITCLSPTKLGFPLKQSTFSSTFQSL